MVETKRNESNKNAKLKISFSTTFNLTQKNRDYLHIARQEVDEEVITDHKTS